MQIGDVAVGGVVQMNVQGVQTNFRVMHHGKPSAIYDDSWLDGTVIMLDWMESPYYQNVSSGLPSKYNYAESAAHALLSETWFTYLDSTVQRLVREVKLPYRTDVDGAPYVVASGANGVAAKVWLPSVVEVARGSGYESNQSSFYVEEGAPFDFWKGADAAKYADWAFVSSSGTDNGWATRTMNKQTSGTGANYYNWVGRHQTEGKYAPLYGAAQHDHAGRKHCGRNRQLSGKGRRHLAGWHGKRKMRRCLAHHRCRFGKNQRRLETIRRKTAWIN